jgi:N-acetylglucosaminyldiphosphoundecaprenol N-acetyl-beta-D-mannosaminyltransferase
MNISENKVKQAQERSITLLGVQVSSISLEGLLEFICSSIQNRRRILLTYVNVYALNLAYETPWFRNFLNLADVVFCDGFGVKLGAKIVGRDPLQRYTPPDWLPGLCEICARDGFSIYLVGAQPGVAQRAVERFTAQFPGLQIVGADHGYFDKTPGSPENTLVLKKIQEAHPNILIVGFGMPAQERWIQENWDEIDANVIIPVGAAIDYLAGTVSRAPHWMTDHGLEWLGRLVIEPRRLWRRYLIGNPLFFWRVLKQRLGLIQFNN